MAKAPEIKWKLPSDPLNSTERMVLDYLERKDSECGILRTPQGIAHSVFPTWTYGASHATKALRVLQVMGLVERIVQFGTLYWRRIRADEKPIKPSGRWVNVNADDVRVLKGYKHCTAFQVMCVSHPIPVSVSRISEDALQGESWHVTLGLLDSLVNAGFAYCNNKVKEDLLYWPTTKGLRHFKNKGIYNERVEKLMAYLKENQKEPERCRMVNIGREVLGMGDLEVTTVKKNIKAIIEGLVKRGIIVKERHATELWLWLKIEKPYYPRREENV